MIRIADLRPISRFTITSLILTAAWLLFWAGRIMDDAYCLESVGGGCWSFWETNPLMSIIIGLAGALIIFLTVKATSKFLRISKRSLSNNNKIKN